MEIHHNISRTRFKRDNFAAKALFKNSGGKLARVQPSAGSEWKKRLFFKEMLRQLEPLFTGRPFVVSTLF